MNYLAALVLVPWGIFASTNEPCSVQAVTLLETNLIKRFVFIDLQLNANSRQSFQGATIPADSPNSVKLPSSTVKDRSDNGKFSKNLTYSSNSLYYYDPAFEL